MDKNFVPFTTILAIEGTPTSDGRLLQLGGMEMRQPPLPIMAQMVNPEAGGHSGSVLVGKIEHIESDGERVMGKGVIDTNTEYGKQVVDLLKSQTLRFVSIDIGAAEFEQDDSPEAVAPMVFTNYEVMGATIVPFPALPGAVIWLDGMDEPPEMTRFMPLQELKKIFAFNPDQERDANGRWGSGSNDFKESVTKDYSNQNLNGVDFSNTDLSHALFENAKLRGANFDGAIIEEADFFSADMRGAKLNNIENSNYASFTGANLKDATATNSDLNNVMLGHANLRGTDFSNSNLEHAYFDMQTAINSSTNFDGAKVPGVGNNSGDINSADIYRERLAVGEFLAASVLAYNPDQERDASGKWGSGGGNSEQKLLDESLKRLARIEPILADAFTPKADGGKGMATIDVYDRLEGRWGAWTQGRADMHKEVVDKVLEKAREGGVKFDQQLVLLGGLPASGKSTIIQSDEFERVIGKGSDFIAVSPDDIKVELAERGLAPKVEGCKSMECASSGTHEEASYVSELILARAASEGMNIIIDTTMGKAENTLDKIRIINDNSKSGTYDKTIQAVLVDIDPATARERADNRYAKEATMPSGGRLIPSEIWSSIDNGSFNPKAVFETLKPIFADWHVFNTTSKESGATLMESGNYG